MDSGACTLKLPSIILRLLIILSCSKKRGGWIGIFLLSLPFLFSFSLFFPPILVPGATSPRDGFLRHRPMPSPKGLA